FYFRAEMGGNRNFSKSPSLCYAGSFSNINEQPVFLQLKMLNLNPNRFSHSQTHFPAQHHRITRIRGELLEDFLVFLPAIAPICRSFPFPPLGDPLFRTKYVFF